MKKKILYVVTQSELGGAQRYFLDLARNFKGEYEITVAFGGQGDQGKLAELLEKAGIRYFVIPHLRKNINPYMEIRAFFELKKLFLDLRPNIIHLSSFKASYLGSIASRLNNKHFLPLVIYTAHGWAFHGLDSWLKRKYFYWAEKLTAKFKDKIICINKEDYETALNILKVNPKKLFLIYHGFDINQYKYLSREEARKKIFGKIVNAKIPDEKTILIASVGNLTRTKGYYFLIKALHYLIIDYGYPITAIIIGEGPEREELEERIIKFHPMDYDTTDGNVGNKIILAGRIENAAELLPAFDYYISTSLKEGFPYTILEAMGAGIPIVATNVGGIPQMIKDGHNGVLIEPRNSKKLAKTVSDLIKNPEARNKMVENAKYDANHLFKFNKMLTETKEVYEK